MYYKINLDGLKGEEKDLKESFADRISLRAKIENELMNCISKMHIKNSDSLLVKTSSVLVQGIVDLGYEIDDLTRAYNLEQCRNCELHNVNLYYKTLYSPGAEPEIVDMLLQQKEKIEDYLVEQM